METEKYISNTESKLSSRRNFANGHKLVHCNIQTDGWKLTPAIQIIQQIGNQSKYN